MEALAGRINALAIDGGETSERAFTWYSDHYHRPEDTLLLIHIFQRPHIPAMEVIVSDHYREVIDAVVKESREVVHKFEQLCREHCIRFEKVLKNDDEPAGHMICQVAREHNADVIITGQRGLGAVKRVLLGSTSDYVLHHAHIPVIVVTP